MPRYRRVLTKEVTCTRKMMQFSESQNSSSIILELEKIISSGLAGL